MHQSTRIKSTAAFLLVTFALCSIAALKGAMGNSLPKTSGADGDRGAADTATASTGAADAATARNVDGPDFNAAMRKAAARESRIATLEKQIANLSVKGRRGRWDNEKKGRASALNAKIDRLRKCPPSTTPFDAV